MDHTLYALIGWSGKILGDTTRVTGYDYQLSILANVNQSE